MTSRLLVQLPIPFTCIFTLSVAGSSSGVLTARWQPSADAGGWYTAPSDREAGICPTG